MLLGPFADGNLDALTPRQLDRFEALLGTADAMLYDWIVGRATAPPEHDNDVLRLIIASVAARHRSP